MGKRGKKWFGLITSSELRECTYAVVGFFAVVGFVLPVAVLFILWMLENLVRPIAEAMFF